MNIIPLLLIVIINAVVMHQVSDIVSDNMLLFVLIMVNLLYLLQVMANNKCKSTEEHPSPKMRATNESFTSLSEEALQNIASVYNNNPLRVNDLFVNNRNVLNELDTLKSQADTLKSQTDTLKTQKVSYDDDVLFYADGRADNTNTNFTGMMTIHGPISTSMNGIGLGGPTSPPIYAFGPYVSDSARARIKIKRNY